ncbi:MAG: RAD55 family ATPase [Thermoplasmata archaeon]
MSAVSYRSLGSDVERHGVIMTYVKGFDEEIGGGIPPGHITLIHGPTGTMKSSLAFYILYNNALDGKRGLYVTLEQEAESLADQMESLGMEVGQASKLLPIFDLSRGREKLQELHERMRSVSGRGLTPLEDGFLGVFQIKVEELKKKHGFELLVIDSLEALELIANFPDRRKDLFDFFEWLRSLSVTTFIVSESSPDLLSLLRFEETFDEAFLADAIIELKMEIINNVDVQRRIRCVKMRSVEHKTDYFTLIHENKWFEITKAIC